MRIFDEAATRRALDFVGLVPALRAAFASNAVTVPPRHIHAIGPASGPETPGGTVLVMPAWNDDHLGIKTINVFPANRARNLAALHATYQLFDARTGVPLAAIDGDVLTAHRTAATSALAASFLARVDASRLLVVGAGRIARLLPSAHASVRPIGRLRVWNHRHDAAVALAADWRAAGWDALAVDAGPRALEQALEDADIVSCATLATEPLIRGDRLAAGVHLDLIGSFTPAMREADAGCFSGARLVVDTLEALDKAGELVDAASAGFLAPADLVATLAQLCRGEQPGRRSAGERTVFKSVGHALQDLVAAERVWQTRHDELPSPLG